MGTQIALADQVGKPTLTRCSKALDRLLIDDTLNFQGAVELIAATPAVHDELRRAVVGLEQRAEPCGVEFLIGQLAPLRSVYGIGQKSPAEWAAFWGIYAKQIEGYPMEAVAAAVDEYTGLGTSEFFPKPGPLKALCEKHATKLRTAIGRARRAIKLVDAA